MSDDRPRETRSRSPSRRRIQVPWWGLTLAGAGVGLLMASWPGAILGGVLGFVAWKLR